MRRKYVTLEAKDAARAAARELRNLTIIREKKIAACTDCGRHYPHYVMDFDHVRGEKLQNIGWIGKSWGWGRARLETELAKCDVVCANCHRERSYGEKARAADRRRAERWRVALQLTRAELIQIMKRIGARRWR